MRTLLTITLLLLLSCSCLAQPGAPTPSPTPPPPPRQLSWLEKALVAAGLITAPGSMKGPDEDAKARRHAGLSGKIWTLNLNSSLTRIGFGQLTNEGGYRSPVIMAGGAQVLALKGEMIVRITVIDKKVEELETVPGILKLVGRSTVDPEGVVVLLNVGKSEALAVATFSTRTKQLTLMPYGTSDDEGRIISNLLGWEREYEGGALTVFDEMDEVVEGVSTTTQFNVFLHPKEKTKIKVTDCVRKNCIQPSFLNGPVRMVAYVEVE